MSSSRRFLVTGATTPLGRALSGRLAIVGEVFGVRGPLDPSPTSAEAIACTADLTRSADVRHVIAGVAAELQIDTAIHLGASMSDSCPAPNAVSTRLLLEGLEQVSSVRAFVLRSTALVYRLRHDDPRVINERHALDLSAVCGPLQRDWLEADMTAGQHVLSPSVRVSVLRLSPLIAEGAGDALDVYLRSDPCYRALGFDPMINVLSLADAAEALARAAGGMPRGVFNISGADTLPLSEVALRAGARCWPVPAALIEPSCALRGMPKHRYRGLSGLLHHGLVVDGRAASSTLGFVASQPLERH